MTNAVAASEKAAPAAVSSSSKKATTAKKTVGDKKAPAAKPSHPPVAQMVNEALATLKDRKGSSLQAIKKYIAATYILDAEKLAPYIRKYLKNAVTNETIVQTRGTGASGSFKLAGKPVGVKKTAKHSAAEKPAAKLPMKKTVKAKEVKLPSDKSPLKSKKSGKAPTAKSKSPKPKKVVAKATKPAK